MSRIYKILTSAQWDSFQDKGIFHGAPIDHADGYIHLSTRAQVEETANKHFAQYESIIVCACETDKIDGALKWEPSRGGDLFPHLYAPLLIDAVLQRAVISRANEAFDILSAFPK